MLPAIDASPFADGVVRRIEEQKRLLREAAQGTANRLAWQARKDLQAEMVRVFDRPTRWTLNAPLAVMDVDGGADIRWREFAGKGNAAARYLAVQVTGGPRRQKGSERRLQIAAPGGQLIYLIPTPHAELDAYGNVRRGFIVKVLSSLEALGGAGQGFDGNRSRTRRSRGRRRGEEYFAIWPGVASRQVPGGRLMPNNLPPGIYRKMGDFVRPVFTFARQAPRYAPRFDPVEVVRRTVAQNAQAFFLRALRRELRVPRGGDDATEVPSVRV